VTEQPNRIPELSVVMPAYNEEEALPYTVFAAVGALEAIAGEWELIIVDDGSEDRTPEILERWRTRDHRIRILTQRPNQGYARALVRGFAAARHMVVLYTDADGQYDLREALTLYPLLKEAEMVAGYRVRRSDSPGRRLASRVFNLVACRLLGLEVRDLNCAFKLFRRSFLELVELTSEGFLIDAELFARADRAGLRWVQVGVGHHPREHGRSTIRATQTLTSLGELWRLARSL
jgi:dolichol-phosphate mannosyltransferase